MSHINIIVTLDAQCNDTPIAQQLRELVQCLDANDATIQKTKRQSIEQIKQSLREQITLPKNNALRMDGPLNLNACGPSSVQCLSGEDAHYNTRKKAQQYQVQYWCAEDTLEKKKRMEEERKRELEYAEYVREQDRIRAELESDATRRKDEEARMRQLENMEYARLAKERKRQEMEEEKRAQEQQTHYLQTCPLLTEDTRAATNVHAQHRFRPDHFKGYDEYKVKQIYQENEAVIEEKHDIDNAEANDEREWAKYHADILRRMEDDEKEKQRRIAQENRIQKETLEQQREILQSRKEDIEKSGLPAIGTEFFQRFGQSCRWKSVVFCLCGENTDCIFNYSTNCLK